MHTEAKGSERQPSAAATSLSCESTSESGSRSESDGEACGSRALADRMATCRQRIFRNAYDYEARAELVKLLRMVGDLDRLREEREAMHALFLLAEEIWLDWIEDERKLARSWPERKALFELFQHSVSDYIAPACWVKFGEFLVELSTSKADDGSWVPSKENMAMLFEKGLAAVGLLMSGAEPFWDLYRKFEAANDLPHEAEKKVRALFHRQLKIPHGTLRDTFESYVRWEADKSPTTAQALQSVVEATLAETNRRLPFESKLRLDESNLSSFVEYIQFEQTASVPPNYSKIKLLYELAARAQPVSEPLWHLYISFLRESLNVKAGILSVCERAVRSMPWSCSLWIVYLEILELHHGSLAELEDVFSRATLYLTATVEELVDFLVAFVDSSRRRWEQASAIAERGAAVLLEIDKVIERCIEVRNGSFGHSDASCQLERYFGWMHAKHASLDKFRSVWEAIIKSHSSEAAFWIEYISLEKFYGSLQKCQTLLKRAASAVTDYPESIFGVWLEFEKYYGISVEELHFARKRIASQRSLLAERADAKEKKQLKRKRSDEADAEQKADGLAKRPHGQHVVFISNIPYRASREEIEPFLVSHFGPIRDVRLIVDAKGQCKGYGYVEFDSQTSVQKSLSLDRILFQGRPLFISPSVGRGEERPKPAHLTSERDPKTLFVSNLSPAVHQNDLFALFSSIGEIEQIRMVTTKDGTSKGRAYVEFKDTDSASRALSLHNAQVGGRRISVFISDPSQARAKIEERSARLAFVPASARGLVPQTIAAHARSRPKQKLGLSWPAEAAQTSPGPEAPSNVGPENRAKPKSNSDFRAMFFQRSI